jgi:hypothetical protein
MNSCNAAVREVVMSGGDTVNGVTTYWGLRYQWQPTDAGRSQSRRPKQSNDCTVRAVASAYGLDYDTAYDKLAAAGRKCFDGFHLGPWLDDQGAEKLSFPAVKGQKRMNPAKFCAAYPKGRFICRTAKHVFAVIDGVVFDTWEQRPDRCIYVAWQVEY